MAILLGSMSRFHTQFQSSTTSVDQTVLDDGQSGLEVSAWTVYDTDTWAIEAVIRYSVDTTATAVTFTGPPEVGFSSDYTRPYAEGTLYYGATSYKQLMLDSLLSTTTTDGGPAVTIAAANTVYYARFSYLVTGTRIQGAVGFGIFCQSVGGTTTIKAGSTTYGFKIGPYPPA